MAGRVQLAVWQRRDGPTTLIPRVCPANDDASGRTPCALLAPMDPAGNLCPFASRFQVEVSGQLFEVWTMDAMMQWLASQDVHGGHWRVICLRCESAGTPPGATSRA